MVLGGCSVVAALGHFRLSTPIRDVSPSMASREIEEVPESGNQDRGANTDSSEDSFHQELMKNLDHFAVTLVWTPDVSDNPGMVLIAERPFSLTEIRLQAELVVGPIDFSLRLGMQGRALQPEDLLLRRVVVQLLREDGQRDRLLKLTDLSGGCTMIRKDSNWTKDEIAQLALDLVGGDGGEAKLLVHGAPLGDSDLKNCFLEVDIVLPMSGGGGSDLLEPRAADRGEHQRFFLDYSSDGADDEPGGEEEAVRRRPVQDLPACLGPPPSAKPGHLVKLCFGSTTKFLSSKEPLKFKLVMDSAAELAGTPVDFVRVLCDGAVLESGHLDRKVLALDVM